MPRKRQTTNGAENPAKKADAQPALDGAGALTPHDGRVLKGFFDHIVELRREQRALGSEVSEIYKEAKGLGYSTASMRDALKLVEMDPAEAALRIDLDQIYYGIARGGRVEPPAQPVARNEAAWQAGRADALAGNRDHAAGWRDKFGAVDYELGQQDGQELRQQASEKLDPPKRRGRSRRAAA
jgi:uncharacterized protein (UPF0335 family)